LFRSAVSLIVSNEASRFLVVGVFNTAAGYLIGVGIYLLLSSIAHIVVIGVLASGISIAVSFLTQRFLVFRSRAPWWPQFRRSLMVYGSLSLVAIPILWWLLEVIGLSIWLAQAVTLVIGAGLSYAGQKWFTFKVNHHVD